MFQQDFTAEELGSRRRRLCEAIGADGWALIAGATGPEGSVAFRQHNDFYYLCGVEVPRCYLLINGSTARTTLFMPHACQVPRESPDEPLSAENADTACALTGVDEVLGLEALGGCLGRVSVLYTPFEDGQGRGASRHHSRSSAAEAAADPWDGRPSRAAHFVRGVRERFPGVEVRNLSPILDDLRLVKSEREQALMRRSAALTAEGVCEAMRSTRPGVREYQLDAVMRYRFVSGGAGGLGYHAIVAGGPNMWYGHYSRNDRVLEDGEWVLCDCAPDYRYYTSDIGRVWPVNGRYSPSQRALYGYVAAYHRAFLAEIRPGRTVREITDETAARMRSVFAGWEFASEADRASAALMFDFRGHLSHSVGMSCHDGFGHFSRPLAPGMVFSVDPSLRDPSRELYVRVEDTVLVTADGIENLTGAAPLLPEDVEETMRGTGLLQAFPPASA